MDTFELNILLLHKYGWLDYSYPHRYNNQLLEEAVTNYYFGRTLKINHDVVYFFRKDNTIFLISEYCKITNQELDNKSKQNQKKEYTFVIYKNKKIKTINISSNIDLLKLIINNSACSEDYIRHFKLNKLLR